MTTVLKELQPDQGVRRTWGINVISESRSRRIARPAGSNLGGRGGAVSVGPVETAAIGGHAAVLDRCRRPHGVEASPANPTAVEFAVAACEHGAAVACIGRVAMGRRR